LSRKKNFSTDQRARKTVREKEFQKRGGQRVGDFSTGKKKKKKKTKTGGGWAKGLWGGRQGVFEKRWGHPGMSLGREAGDENRLQRKCSSETKSTSPAGWGEREKNGWSTVI